jgi:NAD(P)-dependent dehydrogenase (short-subunit alcohol dehydrogenase family)
MHDHKSALVTGSLGGIGFATAKSLPELAYVITLNGSPRSN